MSIVTEYPVKVIIGVRSAEDSTLGTLISDLASVQG
jgi:hypothetical protein